MLEMLNCFRLSGDLIHLSAIIFLLLRILVTRSCAGISAKTQFLYATVFTARYIDVFTVYISLYNTSFKIIFTLSSYIIVCLILGKYRKTYDYQYDTFPYIFLLLGTGVLAIAFHFNISAEEVLWAFSIYLEAVVLLPQFSMIKKSQAKDKDILLYLSMLFLYRFLYTLNWIYRYYNERHYDVISIIGGTVQVILHWDFIHLYIRNTGDIIMEIVEFLTLLVASKSIKEAIVAYRTSKVKAIGYSEVEKAECATKEAQNMECNKENAQNIEYVTKDGPIYTITV